MNPIIRSIWDWSIKNPLPLELVAVEGQLFSQLNIKLYDQLWGQLRSELRVRIWNQNVKHIRQHIENQFLDKQ